MMQQHAMKKPSGENWVRQAEHWIVRGGSLALSIVSGHAVYWFFSAMDGVDAIDTKLRSYLKYKSVETTLENGCG